MRYLHLTESALREAIRLLDDAERRSAALRWTARLQHDSGTWKARRARRLWPRPPPAIPLTLAKFRNRFRTCLAGWTGLEDGAGDELERAYPSPARGIKHLRVVVGAADEPGGAEARPECNSVTKAAEAGAERVRQMLEGALRAWLDTPSAGLRRRLLRLLLELDDLPE